MSEYFSNTRDLTLNHPNLSHVERDQHIHHHHTTTITTAQSKSRLCIQGTEEEEGEFEQYYEVKRADVELNRSICDFVPYNWFAGREFDCEKKFFTGAIVRGNGQSSDLLIVGYEGREGQEVWLEDFKRCTGFLSTDSAHLLAIGRSKIPLLIFAKDLVPAAHFMRKVKLLGIEYFCTLSEQLDCHFNEVWMDPQKGILCRGPRGPNLRVFTTEDRFENVPSSVELLEEDVFRRFLASLKSQAADDLVIQALERSYRTWEPRSEFQFNQPTVISFLTNSPIASGLTSWRDTTYKRHGNWPGGNGQARFAFSNPPSNIILESSIYSAPAWLSRAWSILHAHGLSAEDDLSQYKLIVPEIWLELSLSPSKHKWRRRIQQPIFLFIHPLPDSTPLRSCITPSLHHWSFDEDGQSVLSTDMCHHLGLPVALKLEFGIPDAFSWSNDAYRAVHAYQLARGFDPTTTDFARSLRYPTYKPIQNDSDKFEELEGVVLFANSNTSIDIEPTTGRNSDYLRSSSPSVPYRSQMLDESDVETNCGYSDTDSDSDTSLISIPNDEGYIDTYDDYSDDGSDLSNASSSWLARSISESEVDGPSAISIPNIRLHNAYDGWGDTDSNFLDFHASRVAVYATSDSESEVDDLCIRFGDLALD